MGIGISNGQYKTYMYICIYTSHAYKPINKSTIIYVIDGIIECIYIYIYMRNMHIYIYIHMSIYTYVLTNRNVHTSMSIYVYVHIHEYRYVYTYDIVYEMLT